MRNRRHCVLVLGILSLVLILQIACSPAPDSNDEVRVAFVKIADSQMLPEREDIYQYWIIQPFFGRVTYLKEKEIYEIQFPGLDNKGVEVWGVDMKNSRIFPLNAGALLSAVIYFCKDKNDTSGYCQSYFRQVEVLKKSIGK